MLLFLAIATFVLAQQLLSLPLPCSYGCCDGCQLARVREELGAAISIASECEARAQGEIWAHIRRLRTFPLMFTPMLMFMPLPVLVPAPVLVPVLLHLHPYRCLRLCLSLGAFLNRTRHP
jgi:hypothetical protein